MFEILGNILQVYFLELLIVIELLLLLYSTVGHAPFEAVSVSGATEILLWN